MSVEDVSFFWHFKLKLILSMHANQKRPSSVAHSSIQSFNRFGERTKCAKIFSFDFRFMNENRNSPILSYFWRTVFAFQYKLCWNWRNMEKQMKKVYSNGQNYFECRVSKRLNDLDPRHKGRFCLCLMHKQNVEHWCFISSTLVWYFTIHKMHTTKPLMLGLCKRYFFLTRNKQVSKLKVNYS